MESLRIVADAAVVDPISAGEIIGWLSALGVGGVVTTIVSKWLNKDKDEAGTKEILTRTNRSISEIVEAQTEQLKKNYSEALERIENLEKEISSLRIQLDSDRQIMRIKALESDVRFYKSRIEILEAQNMSMIETIKERSVDDEG